MHVDPVAISALLATAGQFVLFWQRESARAKEAERREKARFDVFLRDAYEREQQASDGCEKAMMAQQAQHNAEIAEITERVHTMELQLQRASLEHAKCPIEIALLKQQVLQLMTRTPTTQEWDQAVAANPDIWAQIKGASR